MDYSTESNTKVHTKKTVEGEALTDLTNQLFKHTIVNSHGSQCTATTMLAVTAHLDMPSHLF